MSSAVASRISAQKFRAHRPAITTIAQLSSDDTDRSYKIKYTDISRHTLIAEDDLSETWSGHITNSEIKCAVRLPKNGRGSRHLSKEYEILKKINHLKSAKSEMEASSSNDVIVWHRGQMTDRNERTIGFVTDYVPGLSLERFLLMEHTQPITESLVVQWGIKILKALQVIHSNGYVLNNLSTVTVIVHSKKPSESGTTSIENVTLCSLEYTQKVDETSKALLPPPTEFTAPELIDIDEKTKWGTSSDIFSFGCIMALCFARGPQLQNKNLRSNSKLLRNSSLLNICLNRVKNTALKRGVAKCFKGNPQERPTAKELLDVFEMCLPEVKNAEGHSLPAPVSTKLTKMQARAKEH